MLHGLSDKLSLEKNLAYGMQHVVYFVVSAVVMPVVVGTMLGLGQHELAGMLQRTFVLCGIVSILQVKFGHRYPIIDGPAGLWTGILTLMAGLAPELGKELSVLRTDLEGGMLIAGGFIMLITVAGLIPIIARLFTPVVNSVLIVLMVLQISPSITKGMAGITLENQVMDPKSTGVFFLTVALILVVSLYARGFLQSIATLVGVVAGWIVAGGLGLTEPIDFMGEGIVSIPEPFAWGTPTFDPGIAATCVLAALVLLSMTFTSVNSMGALLKEDPGEKKMNRAIFIHGLSTCFAGILPTVAFMPYVSSTGVLAMTGVAARQPFALAGVLMIGLGIFSPVGILFASIPVSVGCAALIMIFALIFGQGVKELQKIQITNRESFILGISIIIGVGAMFLPETAFREFPSVLAYILPNGLVDGIITALLLENLLPRGTDVSR